MYLVGGPGSRAAVRAASDHQEGINVAMCDASVRYLTTDLSLPVWWALVTANGHEPIATIDW